MIRRVERFDSSTLGIGARRSTCGPFATKRVDDGACEATIQSGADDKDQQGARGRLTTNAARQPILAPRTSKVPAQDSDFLTTAQGQRLSQTDDSLKAGSRGPTLMEDFHLREKIMHFDHERIPERVVHARGTAAHGVFESYGTAIKITAPISCSRAGSHRCSPASRRWSVHAVRRTRFAMSADSR